MECIIKLRQSLLKVYKNVVKVISLYRTLNYYEGSRTYRQTVDYLLDYVDQVQQYYNVLQENDNIIKAIDIDNLVILLNTLNDAMKLRDYQIVADYLQNYVVSYINTIMEVFFAEYDVAQFKKKCDKYYEPILAGYEIEPTASGYFTMKYLGKYLHSNYPLEQAYKFADKCIKDGKFNYIVYGVGLGYHIMAMLELDENISITIYDADKVSVRLAYEYGVLTEILESGRVKLVTDKDMSKLKYDIAAIDEFSDFIVYEPSLAMIENETDKEWLENYFVNYSSYEGQKRKLQYNFFNNIKKNDRPVDDIAENLAGKNAYIIAAGPSLDGNCRELLKAGENDVIISTGTVLSKLLKIGVKPDYVIATDANISVYPQFEKNMECGIPLLYMATAYYRIANKYKGKRYIIYQKGYDLSEAAANENNFKTYNTGGSVTTTAFDIAVQSGCRRIIGVGLDLAYTGDVDHASGTPFVEKINSEGNYKLIDSVDGGRVKTSKNLDMYRRWIENRIRQEKAADSNIQFIDATEGGARIEGMEIMKLSQCIGK